MLGNWKSFSLYVFVVMLFPSILVGLIWMGKANEDTFLRSLSVEQQRNYVAVRNGLNFVTKEDLLVTKDGDVILVTRPGGPERLPFRISPSSKETGERLHKLARRVARIAHPCDADYAVWLAKFKNKT